MKTLLKTTLLASLSLLLLAVTGCDDSDGDENNPRGVQAPASAAGFAGATIEINPTIEFGANGSSFTLTNDAGETTVFPSTAGIAPIAGTYTYTAGGDTGTLQLTYGTVDITLQLSNFRGRGGNISTFTVTVQGETYEARVVNGEVTYPTNAGGGGGGGNGGGGGGGNVDGDPITIPASFAGTYNLVLDFTNANLPAGYPYALNDEVSFQITTAGELIFDGNTLTNPVDVSGQGFEATWEDSATGYLYSASNVAGSFNEINVALADGTFFAQWVEVSGGNGGGGNGGGNGGGSAALADGTYNLVVTQKTSSVNGVLDNSGGIPNYSVGQSVAVTFSNNLLMISVGDITADGQVSAQDLQYVYSNAAQTGGQGTTLAGILQLNAGAGSINTLVLDFTTLSTSIPPQTTLTNYTLEPVGD